MNKIEKQRKVLYQTIEEFDGNLTNAEVIKESMKLETYVGGEITLRTASAYLSHKNTSTLWKAIKKGVFEQDEYRKVGNMYLIKLDAIERYKREYSGKYGFSSKTMTGNNPRKKKI